MAELHKALESLGPIDWSDVPSDSPTQFMKNLFATGELICNSVPPPPGGNDFSASQPSQSTPDTAKSAKDVTASDARPQPPHPEHAELQKAWGKPIKLSAKENPLGITVYKMAGKDRHGAWFARRSVHEGMSMTKMRKAMQREFAESLGTAGGPGEGAIRGIGADRKLEKKEVEGVGKLEAYQLGAQFPGPTAPREFIALVTTSEQALSDKTTQDDHIPRHYMVISKPLTHPEAADREGYVKGHYESVEMIREIPLTRAPAKHQEAKDNKHELNPVEWIMITRSDPGGGIPRFMVERGTPASIVADVAKFLDWASSKDEIPDPDADQEKQEAAAAEKKSDAAPPQQQKSPSHPQQPQQQAGILSSVTGALGAGIEAYAPASVANYAQSYLQPYASSSSSSSSASSSTVSFASAQDHPAGDSNTTLNVPGTAKTPPTQSTASLRTTSIASSSINTPSPTGSSHHDKELRKLERKRAEIEAKAQKKRDAEATKLATYKEKAPVEATDEMAKHQEKHDTQMKKIEEKKEKDLQKIEQKKEKELAKSREKRQKTLDRDEISRVARERDDFSHQVDMLKRENGTIRDQMADLQRENEMLVQKLHGVGGTEAVKDLQSAA